MPYTTEDWARDAATAFTANPTDPEAYADYQTALRALEEERNPTPAPTGGGGRQNTTYGGQDWFNQGVTGYNWQAIQAQREAEAAQQAYQRAMGLGWFGEGDTRQPTLGRQQYETQARLAQLQYDEQVAARQVQDALARGQLDEAIRASQQQEALSRERMSLEQQLATGYVGTQPTLQRSQLDEQIRAAQAQENADRARLAELQRQFDASTGLDRERLAEQIRATQQQGTLDRARLDEVIAARQQLDIREMAGISGWFGEGEARQPTLARQQYAAQLGANPRNWIEHSLFTRGQTPNMEAMPWFQSVQQNRPLPATSGALESTVSPQTWKALTPTEQEMYLGYASSQGYDPDQFLRNLYQNYFPKWGTAPSTKQGWF